MNYKELKDTSEEELEKILNAQRVARTAFRFHVATGQQKDVRAGRAARKTIARILTLRNRTV